MINFLFIYKYLIRIIDYAFPIAIILLIAQLIIFTYYQKKNISIYYSRIILGLLLSYIILITIVSYYKIPIQSLNVDRWSVIQSFLDQLFVGEYPYSALSHNGNPPGPMPFYFILTLPFYLIGELSLFSIIGFILLPFIIDSKNNFAGIIFYLLSSGFMIWEILTRSNIMTNSVLMLIIVIKFINIDPKHKFRFLFIGILSGFILSTRSIYILVFIIFLLSSYFNKHLHWSQLLYFGSIMLVSFIITFLPFVIYFREEFLIINPFIIQSSLVTSYHYIILFIIISLFFSLLVNNKLDIYFYSGLCLFICISLYSIVQIFNSGFHVAYFNSHIDISYFLFCVPFFLYTLSLRESKLIRNNLA